MSTLYTKRVLQYSPVYSDICFKGVEGVARAGVSRRVQHGLHGAAPQNQLCLQRPHAALPQARYFVHARVFIAIKCFIIIQMCCNCTSIHVSDSGTNIYKKPPIYKHGICSFIFFIIMFFVVVVVVILYS